MFFVMFGSMLTAALAGAIATATLVDGGPLEKLVVERTARVIAADDCWPGGSGTPATAADRRRFLKEFTARALRGDHKAQFSLGMAYEMTAKPDHTRALYWVEKAAKAGDPWAQCMAGSLYQLRGGPQNEARAFMWYKQAAEQVGPGSAAAQPALTALGVMYADGRGTRANPTQAVVWFRRAASKGDPDAFLRLAYMYAMGRGVPRDLGKGKAFLMEALSRNGQGELHDKVKQVSEWLRVQPN